MKPLSLAQQYALHVLQHGGLDDISMRVHGIRKSSLWVLEGRGFAWYSPTTEQWRVTGEGKAVKTYMTEGDRC